MVDNLLDLMLEHHRLISEKNDLERAGGDSKDVQRRIEDLRFRLGKTCGIKDPDISIF